MGWQGWHCCRDTGALAVPTGGVCSQLEPGDDSALPCPSLWGCRLWGLRYQCSVSGWEHPSTPQGHLQGA